MTVGRLLALSGSVTVGSYGPYSTASATSSMPAVWQCEPTAGNDIWFVAQGNANGTATFDTCGSTRRNVAARSRLDAFSRLGVMVVTASLRM